MNRNQKKIIGLIIFMFFGMNMLYSPVSASSVYSLESGWEAEAHGSSSGTSGYVTYHHGTDGDTDFMVDGVNADFGSKCFYWMANSNNVDAHMNLTTDFGSISEFSFFAEHVSSQGTGKGFIKFFDDSISTTIPVFRIRFTGDDIYIYEVGTGERLVEGNWDAWEGDWARFRFTLNDTNSFWLRGYNLSGGLKLSDSVFGYTSNDWVAFDRMIFNSTNGDGSNKVELRLDHFNITVSQGSSEYNICSGTNLNIEQRFDTTGIGWNETAEFRIFVDDDFVGPVNQVDVQIINSTGYIVDSGYGFGRNFYYTYNVGHEYGTGVYNIRVMEHGSSGWNVICPFTVIQGTTSFGSWNVWTDKSYYNVGESADIHYNIPSGFTGMIDYGVNDYLMGYIVIDDIDIVHGTGGEAIIENAISNLGNDGVNYMVRLFNSSGADDVFMDAWDFTVGGSGFDFHLFVNGGFRTTVNVEERVVISYGYGHTTESVYIKIYNSSSLVEANCIHTEFVGTGNNIGHINYYFANYSAGTETFYVALYGSETGVFDDDHNRIVTVNDISGYAEDIQSTNILLGLAVSFGLGIGLLIITKETIVFPITTGMIAFVLSSDAMGSYQYLPAEVGIGLIVVLTLMAFIVWLAK